jgi:hypothetical protein
MRVRAALTLVGWLLAVREASAGKRVVIVDGRLAAGPAERMKLVTEVASALRGRFVVKDATGLFSARRTGQEIEVRERLQEGFRTHRVPMSSNPQVQGVRDVTYRGDSRTNREHANIMARLARLTQGEVRSEFRDQKLIAEPGSTARQVLEPFGGRLRPRSVKQVLAAFERGGVDSTTQPVEVYFVVKHYWKTGRIRELEAQAKANKNPAVRNAWLGELELYIDLH